MLVDLLFVILGIVVLVKSADLLVDSSSDLATKLGVSAVVVGAIIVGFGTSMPEMAVSTTAAVRGDIDLAIGNVIGSIIANLTLVLGVTTFAASIPMPRYFLKFHIPLSMNAVFWFFLFAQNGFRRYEGFILLVMLVISLSLMLRDGKKERGNGDIQYHIPATQNQETGTRSQILNTSVILTSLVGVIASSYFITEGATGLAEEWGVGSGFVGASLVAIGTSLPELVASFVALRKGKSEMVIGTILGSNVFNGVAIGAAIGIAGPGEMIETKIIGWISAILILLAAVIWGLKSLSSKPVGRLAGLTLLSVYVLWLVLVGV